MIFHKRYLIPVWSSRVVSAVITFIITIPVLSNNPPCSETSSEAIFSLHFRHQSPDLYAFFGDRGSFKTTKPWKKILITDKFPTSINLEYVVISCYCSGTGCITGWETLVCLWFVSFGIVFSLQGSIILIIFTIIGLFIIIITIIIIIII